MTPTNPCALEPFVEFGTGKCVMCALARASNAFASDQGKDAAHATGPQVPAVASPKEWRS
jgi:hypothetical protein